MGMKGKVIQIMPAPSNLYATYNMTKEEHLNVLCLALTDQGEILVMDMDDDGFIEESRKAECFKQFKWKIGS
ncbi:hypothetical protein SAMN02746098_01625 [Desulfosporosinus lacus DSM 15449]|uniref:Uncharacterized protein n=2 Tax=Desulfosporosinus TaxID=79206 RepID=A0A1M5WHU9_9FIRM|nr:hypothetical protein SAMN02746098_01625 [Desulfosporosinus lacus DSM 15449]